MEELEIKDLMIFDWVRVDKTIILESQDEDLCIHGFKQIVDIDCSDDDHTATFDGQWLLRKKDISPIPLGESNLLKNGFVNLSKEGMKRYLYDRGNIGINICITDDFDTISITVLDGDKENGECSKCLVCNPPFYVHELQHMLRLLGLNDFADNFKLS